MYPSISDVAEKNKNIGRGYDFEGKPRAFTPLEFFDISCELGLNQDNPVYRKLFENLARWVKNNLQIESSLEIGCGPGYFLNCLGKVCTTTADAAVVG